MGKDPFDLRDSVSTENVQYWEWPFALSYDGEKYDWNDPSTHLFNVANQVMNSVRTTIGPDISDDKVSMFEMAMGILHSGIAVELIAKAFLAELSPGILGADPKSGLILAGQEQWLSSPMIVKTISAQAALSLVREIIQGSTGEQPWSVQNEKKILEARNAVAHLGLVHQEAREILDLAGDTFQSILNNLQIYQSTTLPRGE
ncbi:hypothetical protein [Glutamicibacter protophormiae]